MKPYLALFLLFAGPLHAQFNESSSSLVAGLGYTHEFPGLNGYTLALEYQVPLSAQFRAGIGGRYVNLDGYPRTNTVNEYTKAETIDVSFYWIPLQTENQSCSIGLGYSYSFYRIQRAYPVLLNGNPKTLDWYAQTAGGKTTGINFICEYEYHPDNSRLTFGLRGGLYKAYARTYFIGPVLAYQW